MTESDGPRLAELTGPDQIADLADAATTREGSTLANTGSVELLEVTPLTVRARVHDHDGDVEVRLGSSQSGLKTWCSCGAEGTLCRHAVATALTADAPWTAHHGCWHRILMITTIPRVFRYAGNEAPCPRLPAPHVIFVAVLGG